MPRSHLLRRLGAVVAVAVTLSACTTTTDGHGAARTSGSTAPPSSGTPRAEAPSAPQAPADFTDCTDRLNLEGINYPAGRRARLSFGCARIDVPLDYTKPTGRTIALQLIRVHDSANTKRTGSLLVNPGGPGASGVELAVGLSSQVSDRLLSHFDLIGFDPRGVGLSTPVRCLSDREKDALNAASPDIATTSGFRTAKATAERVAETCERKVGSALAQFTTLNTARDMDRIRQAVRDPKMNFLGFSYGTELGSVYAHLFPRNVRAMVLDGAVNPLTDDIASFTNQIEGFEKAFDQFAADCRRRSACSIGDPRRTVERVVAAARRSPIPSSAPGETRRATTALIYTGILQALYSQGLWPLLARALRAGLNGDSTGLLDLADQYNQRYDGKYTNISDANLAIGCNDSKPGPTDAQIRATARSWTQRFPIFGAWSAPALFSCQQWQPNRAVPPLPTANTPRKVLVVGNLNDPATPYQGAKDLTTTMRNARLLTWDGEGHTSYLQGSACIDRYVDRYLTAGTLPPAGTKCSQ